MTMKQFKIFFLIQFSIIYSLTAQNWSGLITQPRTLTSNLIFNGGFETPDIQGFPDDVSQVNRMESWEDRSFTTFNNNIISHLHSPDWIYTGNFGFVNTLFTPIPNPANGIGMVGLANYELLQQNFKNEDLKAGEYYVVSMYIYLHSLNNFGQNSIYNSSLKCYLAKLSSDLYLTPCFAK